MSAVNEAMFCLFSEDGQDWTKVEIQRRSVVANELSKAKTWRDDFSGVYKRIEDDS